MPRELIIIYRYLSLQRTELKLSKDTYEEMDLGTGPQIKYKVRSVGMYLVIEAAIGLAVLWDRKTTVRIILEPDHMVSYIIYGENERNI